MLLSVLNARARPSQQRIIGVKMLTPSPLKTLAQITIYKRQGNIMTKWKSFDCVAQESLPLTLGKTISEMVKNLVKNLSP